MKKITLLGSTGSIGRQALEVLEHFPKDLEVFALSAHANADLLAKQITKFHPAFAVLSDEKAFSKLKSQKIGRTEVLLGPEGLKEIVSRKEVDLVVDAMVGSAGLLPCLSAIEAGKEIALANKEVLVMAGELVTQRAKAKGVRIIPIDSEHSGMLQCLLAGKPEEIENLYITASGGPFLDTPREKLAQVTVPEALAHPTWKMGPKITIDSATLMNKTLEIIEAHYLFGVEPERIKVLVHPQSIVHSLVEFRDGSIVAQLAPPDMRLPIEYALFFPRRKERVINKLDLASVDKLVFRNPDTEKFPALNFAREVLRSGGTAPAVLNAANEAAVNLFLQERIGFHMIPQLIVKVLESHLVQDAPGLDDILESDRWAREKTLEMAKNI